MVNPGLTPPEAPPGWRGRDGDPTRILDSQPGGLGAPALTAWGGAGCTQRVPGVAPPSGGAPGRTGPNECVGYPPLQAGYPAARLGVRGMPWGQLLRCLPQGVHLQGNQRPAGVLTQTGTPVYPRPPSGLEAAGLRFSSLAQAREVLHQPDWSATLQSLPDNAGRPRGAIPENAGTGTGQVDRAD